MQRLRDNPRGIAIERSRPEEVNIGIVIKEAEKYKHGNTKLDLLGGTIGVYMPALMPEIDVEGDAEEWEEQIPSDIIANEEPAIEFSSNITLANYFEITPKRNTNIHEAPRQKGETVEVVFVHKDPNNAYYTTARVDENMRTYDYLRLFALDRNSVNDVLKEYQFVMDTKEQIIAIRTNDGRNEVDIYTIKMDGKEGQIIIKDTKGQRFLLDTNKSEVLMKNANGTAVQCKGDEVNVQAASEVYIDTPVVKITGDLKVEGSITSGASITASTSNSALHTHPV